MVAMNLNTNTYTLSASGSNSSVTLTPEDANQSSVIVYNASGGDVFLVSGATSAPTAVFPTSATAPLQGKVVGAGQTVTLTKRIGDAYISGIMLSGSGKVYISAGAGE